MSIYEKDGKTVVRLNENKLTIMLRNAEEKVKDGKLLETIYSKLLLEKNCQKNWLILFF